MQGVRSSSRALVWVCCVAAAVSQSGRAAAQNAHPAPIAATLVAPRTPILTSMGFDQVVMTFVVVVLGGIGSVAGSYVAGLSLGLFAALFGALVSPAYTTAAMFALLIAVMALRPGQLAASGNFAR